MIYKVLSDNKIVCLFKDHYESVFWDHNWSGQEIERLLCQETRKLLGEQTPVFSKSLDKESCILDLFYSSVVKGLKDEIAWIRKIHQFYKSLYKHPVLFFFPIKAFNLLFKLIEKSPMLQRNCSHMVMVVARKPVESETGNCC